MSWYNPVPKDNVNVVSGWGEYQLQGNGVPNDATGKLGDTYLNVADNRLYLKRWVANREGAGDKIIFPINLFPTVGDFDFSVVVRRDNQIDDYFAFATTSPDQLKTMQFRINPQNKIELILRESVGGAAQFIATASSSIDGSWRKIGTKRVGSVATVSVDNVVVGTISDSSAWSPSISQTGTFALKAHSASAISIKCYNLNLTGPGGKIISPLNEGTGTTITNQAGANGTLTDGTPTNFWYQAWVPMDLL